MEDQLISSKIEQLAKKHGVKHPTLGLELSAVDMTQSLLQKLLREKYLLIVTVEVENDEKGTHYEYYIDVHSDKDEAIVYFQEAHTIEYDTYELALEAGLQKALSLIKV